MNVTEWYRNVCSREHAERTKYREAIGSFVDNILGLCDLVYSYAILYEFAHYEDALFLNPPSDLLTLDDMPELQPWKQFIEKQAFAQPEDERITLELFSYPLDQCNRSICFWERQCTCNRPLTREYVLPYRLKWFMLSQRVI